MTGKLKDTTKILLISLLAFTLACDNQAEDENGADIQVPSISNLEGRWGITSIDSNGSQRSLVPCENTITIESNGNFLFVMNDSGEWGEGTVSYDETDSTLTLSLESETVELKLLSVSSGELSLQSQQQSASGTITLVSNQFVKLESTSCPSVESSMLQDKWSIQSLEIKSFELNNGDKGDLISTDLRENIPENYFTLNFLPDGFLNVIDLVSEYEWFFEPYRILDDYNLVRTAQDDAGESTDHIMHVFGFDAGILEVGTTEFEVASNGEEVLLEVRIRAKKNSSNVPTITANNLLGKWSASEVEESLYRNDRLEETEVMDNIPHNKMTLEFQADNELQLIDLMDGIGVTAGEFLILDGSNILLDIGGESDSGQGTANDGRHPAEQNENFELFHLISNDNAGNVVFKTWDVDESSAEDYRGEFEVTLTKNDGTEAGLSLAEIIGEWEVESVTDIARNTSSGDGPVVGMLLNYESDSTGVVTYEGDEVVTYDFNFLDQSNIHHSFYDGSGSEGDVNIFHLEVASSNQLVLVIYAEIENATTGEQEMAALWRLSLFKND